MSIAFALACVGGARAQDEDAEIPLPAQAPVVPELPDRNPLIESETDEVAEDENEAEVAEEAEIVEEIVEEEEEEETGEEADREDEAPSDSESAEIPPVPSRRTPPERTVRRYDAPIGPPPRPEEWSSTEIAEAKAKCENLLADEAIFAFEVLEPIREGICGTPAPISLGSVTAGQTVTIRPAAKLTCRMASQFQRWMVESVQPSAKTHLETEITGVLNVASYHCRTRYDDPGQRMSQHAFANALDLAGFITAKGEQISVEKSWPGDTPQSRFLKEIHAGACKIFGTVLGPEANAAHSNHFHLDMTQRRHGSYCQ